MTDIWQRLMRWLLCIAVILIAGCGPEPDMPMWKKQRQQSAAASDLPISDNSRFEVTRVGVFRDDLAYQDRRGVYIIKDRTTGREFVGVSGIGISELGSHQAGKARVTDEK